MSELVKFQENGKYGFKDEDGIVLVSAIYEDAGDFSEGLAFVQKNGKLGYIDKSGALVLPFEYDFAGVFSEGLAYAQKNGKLGYIDKSGAEVLPFEYDFAWDFREGLAEVKKNGEWCYVDKKGNRYNEENAEKYKGIVREYRKSVDKIVKESKEGILALDEKDCVKMNIIVDRVKAELDELYENTIEKLAEIPKMEESENS